MVEILIQDGDAKAAADELAAAVRDIFAVEPTRTATGGTPAPGTRALMEAALIILALPPAAIGTADILGRVQFADRLRRLIARVAALRKTTHSKVLIDPGDGHHIPLEEASHDAILAALRAIEHRLKS